MWSIEDLGKCKVILAKSPRGVARCRRQAARRRRATLARSCPTQHHRHYLGNYPSYIYYHHECSFTIGISYYSSLYFKQNISFLNILRIS